MSGSTDSIDDSDYDAMELVAYEYDALSTVAPLAPVVSASSLSDSSTESSPASPVSSAQSLTHASAQPPAAVLASTPASEQPPTPAPIQIEDNIASSRSRYARRTKVDAKSTNKVTHVPAPTSAFNRKSAIASAIKYSSCPDIITVPDPTDNTVVHASIIEAIYAVNNATTIAYRAMAAMNYVRRSINRAHGEMRKAIRAANTACAHRNKSDADMHNMDIAKAAVQTAISKINEIVTNINAAVIEPIPTDVPSYTLQNTSCILPALPVRPLVSSSALPPLPASMFSVAAPSVLPMDPSVFPAAPSMLPAVPTSSSSSSSAPQPTIAHSSITTPLPYFPSSNTHNKYFMHRVKPWNPFMQVNDAGSVEFYCCGLKSHPTLMHCATCYKLGDRQCELCQTPYCTDCARTMLLLDDLGCCACEDKYNSKFVAAFQKLPHDILIWLQNRFKHGMHPKMYIQEISMEIVYRTRMRVAAKRANTLLQQYKRTSEVDDESRKKRKDEHVEEDKN